MRHNLLSVFLMAALLGGCATNWVRHGTPKVVMEQDHAHCYQKAAALYPPRIVTVQISPGYMQPATQQCQSYGRYGQGSYCQEYPAQWMPPQYGQQDANVQARQAWVHACMRGLGFHAQ